MVDFQSRDTRRGHDERTDDPPGEEEQTDQEERDREGHVEDEHHHHHDVEQVGVAVVTVSSTRSLDDDPSGDAIAAAFEADGHEVVTRELLQDSYDGVQSTLDHLVNREDVDVVVTTGGTGVTPDDVTVEAAMALFQKTLPGFGELFRRLSYDEIGTKVVGTRATAGVADGVPVFCLPGSEHAARLGAEDVILPQVGHLAGLAHRVEETE